MSDSTARQDDESDSGSTGISWMRTLNATARHPTRRDKRPPGQNAFCELEAPPEPLSQNLLMPPPHRRAARRKACAFPKNNPAYDKVCRPGLPGMDMSPGIMNRCPTRNPDPQSRYGS